MKVFWAVILAVFLSSCSKDIVESSDDSPGLEKVTYEEVNKRLEYYSGLCNTYKGNNVNDFAKIVKGAKYVTNVEVQNNVVKAKTNFGLPLEFSFNQEVFENATNSFPKTINRKSKTNQNLNSEYYTRGTTESNIIRGRRLLRDRNIAIWCPWDEKAPENLLEILTPYINNLKKHKDDAEKCKFDILDATDPLSFKEFNKYDVVYVLTHGINDGNLTIPIVHKKLYLDKYCENGNLNENCGLTAFWVMNEEGTKKTEYLKLDENFLNKYLPSDLSRTIIWSSCCYSGNSSSALLNSSIKNNCMAYYGPDGLAFGRKVADVFEQFASCIFYDYTSSQYAFQKANRLYPNSPMREYATASFSKINIKKFTLGESRNDNTERWGELEYWYSSDSELENNDDELEIYLKLLNKKTGKFKDFKVEELGQLEQTEKDGVIINKVDYKLKDLEPGASYEFTFCTKVNGYESIRCIWDILMPTLPIRWIDLGLPSGNLIYCNDNKTDNNSDAHLMGKSDFQELLDFTNASWGEYNFGKGVWFSSKQNTNKVFFEAGGFTLNPPSVQFLPSAVEPIEHYQKGDVICFKTCDADTYFYWKRGESPTFLTQNQIIKMTGMTNYSSISDCYIKYVTK